MHKRQDLYDLKPRYIFSEEELKVLWNWLQFQTLPHNNDALKELVKQIGDFAYTVKK
jgi:hypothetical protein